MRMAETRLEELFHQGLLWRGGKGPLDSARLLASGFSELDELIGGWPRGALVELLCAGSVGLSLLLPLLARLSGEGRWLAWVDPPWHPHAPALAARGVALSRVLRVRTGGAGEALWAAEQLLRSGNCAVVMLWPGRFSQAAVRRLQLAAAKGDSLGVLFRPWRAAQQPSLAALRLQVQAGEAGLRVRILKRRGGRSGAEVELTCSG